MPILGTIASSYLQSTAVLAYESIATITSASGTITFTSIPATYKHLQIRAIGKNSNTTYAYVYLTMQLNTDTGNNYDCHSIYGVGGSVGVMGNGTYTNQMIMGPAVAAGGGVASQVSNPAIIDILDYADTNKFKTLRSLSGFDANGQGDTRLLSGVWKSTAAVTSVSLIGFDTQVHAALYGIKGA